MIKALNTAATGMAAQETNVDTISNNISNLNTTGYKKQRAETEDLLYETVTEAGARSSANTQYTVGVQIGSGSKISAIRKTFTQGSPKPTNNPFDLMISGEGFIGISMPNGEIQYTRDGAFSLDNTGTLVTKAGHRVLPGLTFPQNLVSVNISEDGNVDAYLNGQVEPNNLGVIPIFTFANPSGLRAMGGNLYRATSASGAPVQNVPGQNNAGKVQQGFLETSNVRVMDEMTNLIKAQRAYEMNAKVMNVADQMLQTVNNIR